MRLVNTMKNVIVGVSTLFISTIANFALRTIFIYSLGKTYLGVNGLLTNILSMLSLAELGIGSAIGFSLYKPLSQNDTRKINSLMKYYKKVYYIIGLVVFIIGLGLMPFLSFFVKEGEMVPNLYLIYFIYLVTTSYSYLFTYKRTLVASDQKSYKLSLYDTLFSLLSIGVRIVYLCFGHNFVVYLLISFVFTLLQNIVVNIVIDRLYPYLKEKKVKELSKKEKESLFTNIKGLMFHKVGNYLVNGTDNIIMSKFISLDTVGLFSNYSLIMNTVNMFLSSIFGGAVASFGNLIVSEDKKKIYSTFKLYNFIGFWIYSFSAIAFFFLLNPFIDLWLGNDFLIGKILVFVVVTNFYFNSMLGIIDNVKSSAGIYYQDRYIPIIQAIVNLAVSIILVQKIGLIGVFLGTSVSILFVIFLLKPYFLYKYLFNQSVISYYIDFIKYLIVLFIEGLIVYLSINLVSFDNSLLMFVYIMIMVLLIPNLINYFIYRNSDNFKELLNIVSIIKDKSKAKFSHK